ncbi:MAG: SLC13 family permease [Chloroflexota bacterium]
MIILGALLFWRFRLAFAFLGLATLLALGLTNPKNIVEFAGLDIILFLIGMMILIGFLEERHFFERIVDAITGYVGPHAIRLTVVLMGLSALFAALVDEVTSILFMGATVFQLSGRYRVSPVPLLIMVVFATNIGSAATVVGNPVGVMIALRAGLTFADFLRWATPIALLALAVSIPLLLRHFRKPIAELGAAMRSANPVVADKLAVRELVFSQEMRLPWALFGGTILLLILHTPIEKILGLEKNAMLLGTSLAVAGLVLMLERERARELVEKRVEWWSLSFFILLFASVGTLNLTGVTNVLASRLADAAGGNEVALFFSFTWVAGIGSAFMDNVLAIATLIPVVQELGNLGLDVFPLWWGMLFAGTFLGNLTMIGSTANIVAIGMLERRGLGHISMGEWMRATAIPSILTLAIASALIYLQLLR